MFIESKRNEYCTQIVELLKKYYDSVGIYPERENNERYSFHCSNKEKCSGDNLARGMQCHIGYNYGETLKVVVSALDCGNGGADIIERRTHNVLTSHNNPHMRGTLKAVSLIIDKTNKWIILAVFARCVLYSHDLNPPQDVSFLDQICALCTNYRQESTERCWMKRLINTHLANIAIIF